MIIQFSEAPGVSKLTADYLDRFEAVADFYRHDFHDWLSFENIADRVDKPAQHRQTLCEVLREQNQALGAGAATLENIDSLSRPGSAAVISGQQVGLFGGPLYTVYKALTAIKLAEKLNRSHERRFVPVFWLASEDHDFAEVDHIKLLDRDNDVKQLQYRASSPPDRVPLFRLPLEAQISELFDELESSTHPTDFRGNILESLREYYQPGRSFAAAFAGWAMRLFRHFGLVVVDAADPRLKKLAGQVFHREIADGSPSTRAVLETTERLVGAGYPPQVHLQEGLLNLFYLDDRRQPIAMSNGRYLIKDGGESVSQQELLDEVQSRPELFSPNVVLRPVVQDALFPTVAYVAGPAEINYFAQYKGVYDAFGVQMPIIFPRKSMTLLEGKVDKVLDKYQLTVRDFWNHVEALISRIVRDQLPEPLQNGLVEASRCIQKDLDKVGSEVIRFEPSLKNLVESTKGKVTHQISGLEKKILQAYKKQNDVVRQQLSKAANNLYPGHNLQERELNITPYLFKYDWALIDRLYEVMDISKTTHQVVRI